MGLQLISLGGAETRVGMRGALLLGAASCLEGGMGQDTGGPFKGSLAISRQTPGHCIDNRGHIIPEAMLFEPPGQDQCQVCTCLRQLPVLCRTVLCAPPQGCHSLRAGNACCEWVCDRWDEGGGGSQVSDLGLRLVASAVTAILSLSLLFFLIYRLRQRKLRSRQNHLEAESYSGGGGGQVSLGEEISMPELDLKPDDRLTLQRPFPPSYDEAVFGSIGPMGEADTEFEAPPYSSIQHDPVISYPASTAAIHDSDGSNEATSLPAASLGPISYPVATLGRLVLPAPPLLNLPGSRTQQPEPV